MNAKVLLFVHSVFTQPLIRPLGLSIEGAAMECVARPCHYCARSSSVVVWVEARLHPLQEQPRELASWHTCADHACAAARELKRLYRNLNPRVFERTFPFGPAPAERFYLEALDADTGLPLPRINLYGWRQERRRRAAALAARRAELLGHPRASHFIDC